MLYEVITVPDLRRGPRVAPTACRSRDGNVYGGITWGPGYVTKHSCSNGPIVSPLVWLYELYKDKSDVISYVYIDTVV